MCEIFKGINMIRYATSLRFPFQQTTFSTSAIFFSAIFMSGNLVGPYQQQVQMR